MTFNVKSERIYLKPTEEADLDFVVNTEQQPENARFVGQWSKQEHSDALHNKDIRHIIVIDIIQQKPVGYVILAGITNPNRSIEFKRIVITDKGKGFGRETLKAVKKLAFESFKAHRLWLDVRYHNPKAQSLYKSEGFVGEGVLRDCIFLSNKFESLVVMSILENEYYNINI